MGTLDLYSLALVTTFWLAVVADTDLISADALALSENIFNL